MNADKTIPERASAAWRLRLRQFGLAAGPTFALITYSLLPPDYQNTAGEAVLFSSAGRATLAVMVWMAIWWLTEAVDISATALLPVALFPLFGIATVRAASAPYANDLIFLFMGGFILALAMQRWGLDRRIALSTLRLVGTRPANIVGGFMLATALLSSFVSNTATAAMMLPIGLSVINFAHPQRPPHLGAGKEPALLLADNFALCVLLGIAYAASIGGVATVIGSPPNLFLVGFINEGIAEPYQQSISFLRWMAIGVPLALVFLPLTWWLLTRVLYPLERESKMAGQAPISEHYQQLGSLSRAERMVFFVFALTAIAWVTRPYLSTVTIDWNGILVSPLAGLSDPGIAIAAALTLFVLPANRSGEFVMDWKTANQLPWGILILFGGGLSLATAVQANGAAEFIGAQALLFDNWSALALVVIVITAVIFLTELTSNTATVATLVPILAALAPGLGLHPYQLIVPATIAASCAFMMPVATPPNAIVFAAGYLTIPQMCKAGIWLNAIGIFLITLLMYAIAMPLLIS